MKKIFLLLIVSSLTATAQNTVNLPDSVSRLNQSRITRGASLSLTTTGWTSTAYHELYAPKTLPANAIYTLRLYIEKSGQASTTQLYHLDLQWMQSNDSDAPLLTPYQTFQTSDDANPALKVRYRKPQGSNEAGVCGIEATVLSSAYEGGKLTYSLMP